MVIIILHGYTRIRWSTILLWSFYLRKYVPAQCGRQMWRKMTQQTWDRYLRNKFSTSNNIDRWNGFLVLFLLQQTTILYCKCAKRKRSLIKRGSFKLPLLIFEDQNHRAPSELFSNYVVVILCTLSQHFIKAFLRRKIGFWWAECELSLTHFWSMFPFFTLWKPKVFCFQGVGNGNIDQKWAEKINPMGENEF